MRHLVREPLDGMAAAAKRVSVGKEGETLLRLLGACSVQRLGSMVRQALLVL